MPNKCACGGMADAPVLGTGGKPCGFKSHLGHQYAGLAQLAEQLPCKQ
jgi:hypothetical protein